MTAEINRKLESILEIKENCNESDENTENFAIKNVEILIYLINQVDDSLNKEKIFERPLKNGEQEKISLLRKEAELIKKTEKSNLNNIEHNFQFKLPNNNSFLSSVRSFESPLKIRQFSEKKMLFLKFHSEENAVVNILFSLHHLKM